MGNWREYYDADNTLGLQYFLNLILNWSQEDLVLFCINKEIIIKTNYKTFLDNIFNFLELHDDCPILVNISKNNILDYIYFSSLGNIFHSTL